MTTPVKMIICKDVHGNTTEIQASQLTFRPCVYGIIVRDNQILLVKEWDGYDLPGGGIELGETIQEALIREVKEETGLEIAVQKIVAGETSFYTPTHNRPCVQSISLYFECAVLGGSLSLASLDEYEKEYSAGAEWVALDKIHEIKFISTVDVRAIITRQLHLLATL